MEKLYHIRKFYDEEEDYHVGQILEFNKEKNNNLREYLLNSDGYYLDHYNEKQLYWERLEHIFNIDLNKVPKDKLERMKSYLNNYLHKNGMYRRESVLEEVRREKYIEKPSRYHCMWLTNEESLDSWIMLLSAEKDHFSVFEMELDGNLFCSTDELLPDPDHKLKEIYEEAEKYWNPTPKDIEDSIKREYIFEGIAKVKRKVK